MTSKMIETFPRNGGTFQIEPDASSGSYFLALNQVDLPGVETMEFSRQFGIDVATTYYSSVQVAHWPQSGWQIDERFPDVARMMTLPRAEADLPEHIKRSLRLVISKDGISRAKNLGDSIMTAIVIAPVIPRLNLNGQDPLRFTDLGRLRLQECERVTALRTELTRCGARVVEQGDTLEVFASELHGAEIETYNDHRMAMCFAILGLKVPGIKIQNPACVKKTFPNFFQKLAAPAPNGLGATVLDGHSGRALGMSDLFAD
jgi:3-phosphoshikimate 1-carboxyvinyltransferase